MKNKFLTIMFLAGTLLAFGVIVDRPIWANEIDPGEEECEVPIDEIKYWIGICNGFQQQAVIIKGEAENLETGIAQKQAQVQGWIDTITPMMKDKPCMEKCLQSVLNTLNPNCQKVDEFKEVLYKDVGLYQKTTQVKIHFDAVLNTLNSCLQIPGYYCENKDNIGNLNDIGNDIYLIHDAENLLDEAMQKAQEAGQELDVQIAGAISGIANCENQNSRNTTHQYQNACGEPINH